MRILAPDWIWMAAVGPDESIQNTSGMNCPSINYLTHPQVLVQFFYKLLILFFKFSGTKHPEFALDSYSFFDVDIFNTLFSCLYRYSISSPAVLRRR